MTGSAVIMRCAGVRLSSALALLRICEEWPVTIMMSRRSLAAGRGGAILLIEMPNTSMDIIRRVVKDLAAGWGGDVSIIDEESIPFALKMIREKVAGGDDLAAIRASRADVLAMFGGH